MKKYLKIQLFICLCLATNGSYASTNEHIPLWGATYYGMSVNEVFACVSGTHSIADGEQISLPIAQTSQTLAKLDNVEIAGEHLSAWFIFNAGKLNQVILTLVSKTTETKAPLPSADLSALYAIYTRLLSIKYGNPVAASQQIVIPPTLPSGHIQWVFGLTNIDLNLNNSRLDISYGAQYANDLRNL